MRSRVEICLRVKKGEIAVSENKTGVASRRQFLTQTSRIAGASALAGVAIPHVHAAENNTVQVALVGCGGRGPERRPMRCRSRTAR